jgi:AhpD family alkylhydroperoxidase
LFVVSDIVILPRDAPAPQHQAHARACIVNGGTVTKSTDEFNEYRKQMNERMLGSDHLGIKRFFALDHQAYEGGALDSKTKELLGLVASLVLRCDDCITYHVLQCVEQGVKRDEFLDTFNVALVVGGSITIPHLRRAFERMDESLEETKA